MSRRIICIVLASIILITYGIECWGYNGEEHAAIDDWILDNSVGFDMDDYVRNSLGIDSGMRGKSIRSVNILNWLTIINYNSPQELIAQGGKDEDSPFWRCRYHFHDPLQLWGQAGYHYSGISADSSIIWAQKNKGEQSFWNGGNYSWYDARDYFYKALTGTDADQRNSDLYSTFLAVGHLMHLIQDSSCPEHVRNDSHGVSKSVFEKLLTYYNDGNKVIEYSKFQGWLQSGQNYNYPFFNALFPASLLGLDTLPSNARIPIARIVDTDRYTGDNPNVTLDPLIGLAEFTNANFLSQGRIFEGYDYPNKDSSVTKEVYEIADPRNNGSNIEREYLKKTGNGATGYRLSTTSITGAYQTDLLDPIKIYRVSALDNNVLEDYAAQLIPRAENYSAALLNYFFRGTMEITLPPNGLYTSRDTEPGDPTTQGFNKVNLLVRNTTSTGEQMLGGEIDLVVQYRFLTDSENGGVPKNPFISDTYAGLPGDMSHFHPSKPQYIVVKNTIDKGKIDSVTPYPLEFDLSGQEIPLWAVDVRFFVVYKGDLGKDGDGEYVEKDAICVGFKDVSEPTPIVFGNSDDIFCYNGTWVYDLNIQQNLDNFKEANKDNPCIQDMTSDAILNLSISFSPNGMTPVHYGTVDEIDPGQYQRMYVITDYDATLNYYSNSFSQPSNTENKFGLRNGMENINNTLTWIYPTFIDKYRGIEQWSGSFFVQWCASCLDSSNCEGCDDNAINKDLVPCPICILTPTTTP